MRLGKGFGKGIAPIIECLLLRAGAGTAGPVHEAQHHKRARNTAAYLGLAHASAKGRGHTQGGFFRQVEAVGKVNKYLLGAYDAHIEIFLHLFKIW